MGIFEKSNYIINTGIIEQVFQCFCLTDHVTPCNMWALAGLVHKTSLLEVQLD